MGVIPIGFQWEAIYPLMDRKRLSDDEWNDLHDSLMILEVAAIEVIKEFSPEDKEA